MHGRHNNEILMSLRKRKNTLFKSQRYSISFCQLNSTYKIICGVAVGLKSLSIIGFSIRESMIGFLPCLNYKIIFSRPKPECGSNLVLPLFPFFLFFSYWHDILKHKISSYKVQPIANGGPTLLIRGVLTLLEFYCVIKGPGESPYPFSVIAGLSCFVLIFLLFSLKNWGY